MRGHGAGPRSRALLPHLGLPLPCCSVPPASEKLLGGGIYRNPPTSQGFLIVFLHQDFVLGY